MKKVLILGENGMLGNAVHKHFSERKDYEVVCAPERWPEDTFKSALAKVAPDAIVNCIGKIPQRHPTEDEYQETNIELPTYLETLGVPVIYPTTDCEFSGRLPEGSLYTKASARDAEDAYGKSKATISERIEYSFSNTKIIRTSIIGHERASNVSLLDWFLSTEGTVKGYTNHYWNGVTTLTWARLASDLIENWDAYPVLNQHGTQETASKYEVLSIIRDVYGTNSHIEPFETPETVNKCLLPDTNLPNLRKQLQELKTFYQR